MITEDELTKKRRVAALTTELADAVASATRAIGALRQECDLSSRTIIRQTLQGLRTVFPREMETLHNESMIDAMSGLMELLEVVLQADADDNAVGRRVIGMMEGDPMFAGVVAKMESAIDRFGTSVPAGASPPKPPCWATIQRLFKENPSPLPDQAPAIECGVMLRGVPVTLLGSLSETREGGLRLLSPDPTQERPRPGMPVKMIEQFFDYEDVMVVAVRRAVTMEAPRIIQSS
jgi:hypothetical protein